MDSTLTLNGANERLMPDVESDIQQRIRIDRFLANIQKSGYRMAQLATSNPDDALDLVQETMLQLVKRYADRPNNELRILYFRILSSRITDWYRKTAFRRQFQAFFSTESYQQGDPVQELCDEFEQTIDERLDCDKQISSLVFALKNLSPRQHQVFLLRAWQGFSVKETAEIMGCSAGSVKTHYSRALSALRSELELNFQTSFHQENSQKSSKESIQINKQINR